MVEVFKTNIFDKWRAEKLIEILYQQFPACKINFDLDDCDKVLRIEGEYLLIEKVKTIISENGFVCEALE